jgi:uncharacterized protein (TIGR03435 family)
MTQIRYRRRVAVAVLPVLFLLPTQFEAQYRVDPISRPRFEAASIRERDPRTPLGVAGLQVLPGGLVARCASLKALLFYAYRLTLSSPVTGLPNWADTACSADSGTNTFELQATMPPDTTSVQAREMMQTLLAERFKLASHWETKPLPVYALVISRGGFKLKLSDPGTDPPRTPGSIGCPKTDPACRILPLGSSSISALTPFLASSLGRPVIDRTGLTGTYYMNLMWAGDNSPDSPLPSLPTALQEQFGLELKADTGPVEVLVIDHVEKPTPN